MKADLDSDDSGIVAEINMIPLIDVSLVLLIIFMVLTPVLVRSQIKVNLPPASSGQSTPGPEEKLEVQVDRAGSSFIEGRPVSIEQLGQMLKTQAEAQPELTVIVSADQQVTFEHVVAVMDAAKNAGVTKVGVAVSPVKTQTKR